MKTTRVLMGMPITVELVDARAEAQHLEDVFRDFHYVDEMFSTYKPTSEISRINRGELLVEDAPQDVRDIFQLADDTKRLTGGYFDIARGGSIDPSGIVKGWAIERTAQLLRRHQLQNFYVEAGGDIAVAGHNAEGQAWRVGVRHPFQLDQIAKVLAVTDSGVATSGTYLRGRHIYDPLRDFSPVQEIASLTVIGPNIYEADRFATAAFAMGRVGITFIERLEGFEGYMIDAEGTATLTSNFATYLAPV